MKKKQIIHKESLAPLPPGIEKSTIGKLYIIGTVFGQFRAIVIDESSPGVPKRMRVQNDVKYQDAVFMPESYKIIREDISDEV